MINIINKESVQEWLESYNSAVPVAETAFPPRDANGRPNRVRCPFIVYLDDVTTEGGDFNNMVRFHDLDIEFYTEDGKDSAFTSWLYDTGLHFTRMQSYLPTEQLYMSTYSLEDSLTEKEAT